MLRIHPSAAALLAAGLAVSVAQAQVSKVAYTTDDDDPFGARNTDAGLSVNDEAVLTTANMRLSLFSRTGSLLDDRQVGDTDWPFLRVDTGTGAGGPSRFFDPQTVYQPVEGRLWMLYSEENVTGGSGGSQLGELSAIHLAVSREMVGTDALDTLDYDDWWYYTGDATNVGQAGPFFNMQATMAPYRIGLHAPFPTGIGQGLVDKPHMAVDEQAVYITMNGNDVRSLPGGGSEGFNFNAIAIIPTSHGTGGTLSILDGERPASADIVFLRNTDLPVEDTHARHYTVQEPFEQVTNAQFILSVNPFGEPIGTPADSIRLAGLWFNDSPPSPESPRWEYSQRVRVKSGTVDTLEHDPIDVDAGFEFSGGDSYQPQTPDTAFRPAVAAAITFFPSAVLVKDNNNDWRIFAVHHVRPVVQGVTQNQWVIQWYVIDPHLDKFRAVDGAGTTPSTEWKPDIVAMGRVETAGDRYHPVIGVTQQGVAYIEYTYSSQTVWPQVRRVTLNSSYTGIVPNSEVTVQSGPANEYLGSIGGWADFADMQADPVTGCAFWSTHTLVHQNALVNDRRDVWLFQTLFNCGNSNLNFDSGTDLYDMAMFNDLYSVGARRVDMNIDGTTDATDATLYQNAYDAATRP